jgi:inhibitor of KinA sporulation pathway (predicted exonuclease)
VQSVARFLTDVELIPSPIGSLQSAVAAYKLDNTGAHTALSDALNTYKIYKLFVEQCSALQKGVSGGVYVQ